MRSIDGRKSIGTTLRVSTEKTPINIKPGSEEFMTEHYWGYNTKAGNDHSLEYQVEHPRWEIYPVHIRTYSVHVDFAHVYGQEFDFFLETKPASVLLAEGSEISVLHSQKI